MADTLAVKELKQIRAILGKILKVTESQPKAPRPRSISELSPAVEESLRKASTACNVTLRCDTILYHLDAGNLCIARQLVCMLVSEEGERR